MKLLLDDNLGASAAELLAEAGHDVATVKAAGLVAATDAALLAKAGELGRVLVTLDFDFANPVRFPPGRHGGVVVLVLPTPASLVDVPAALATFHRGLALASPAGALWMVREDRIRHCDEKPPESGRELA